jgi:hypothetical protein
MGETKGFRMCGHPEWLGPGARPEPSLMVGTCPLHDYICTVCGFGAGQSPRCRCDLKPILPSPETDFEPLFPEEETAWFGTHIREAIRVIRNWWAEGRT